VAAVWDVDPAVLGTYRSVLPAGGLLHLADRIDVTTPPNEHELLIDVDLLHVDATSFRDIARRQDDDPTRIADEIEALVAERGALRNPRTGSGGVARGRVAYAGQSSSHGAAVGDLVVPLVSLIALPLSLDGVGPVDPRRPEVPVQGRAVVTGRMPVLVVPDDLAEAALTAADVYPVASYARDRARRGDHVVVLGAGNAGLLGAIAAAEAVGLHGSTFGGPPEAGERPSGEAQRHGRVSVVDIDARALTRLAQAVPGAVTIEADARDAVGVTTALRDRGAPPADLTLACTTVAGCEGTAVLVTAPTGTVLFFSTATSFAGASLGTDPLGSAARLELSNGVTPDHGRHTLDLLRRHPVLREAFAGR
jgi:L-erythro-3,5-diaminohexanoate dehydrogenase